MKNGRLKSFTLVVLIALLLAGGHSALAFVAPVQDVTTSLVRQGMQDVYTFSVWDPALQQEVTQSVTYESIKFPTSNEGIVAFVGVNSGFSHLNCWVFNPVTHQWIADVWGVGSQDTDYSEVLINTGVVTFKFPGIIYPTTYDPQRGWVRGFTIMNSVIEAYVNQNGIVGAWTNYVGYVGGIPPTPVVGPYYAKAAIYDPRDGNWESRTEVFPPPVSGNGNFSVQAPGGYAIFQRGLTTL